MLFNSVVVGALAVFSCVAAVPSRAAKRQEVDASNVIEQLNDLQSKLTPIENDLTSAIEEAKATGSNDPSDWVAVTGLLTDLDTELIAAGAGFPSLLKRGELVIRQDDSANNTEVAELVAEIVEDILNALDAVQELVDSNPILAALLSPLLSSIDVDLAIILTGLGLVLSGVLALVADLLSGLGAALSGLGGSSAGVLDLGA